MRRTEGRSRTGALSRTAPRQQYVAGSIPLRVYDSASPRAALVLAHGAGAGQASPFMVRAASALAARGIACATFDFPYITEGRRVPDRAPVLEAAWVEAVVEGRARFGPLPLFIGGKSMGGRIASHVAAAGVTTGLAGLIFFGYPLHPPGKPEQRRDAHLPRIGEPMLFVQGSRDPFGTGDEIRALLPSLRRATLYQVDGGDHSFKVPRAAAGDPLEGAMAAAAAWIVSIVDGGA